VITFRKFQQNPPSILCESKEILTARASSRDIWCLSCSTDCRGI